MQWARILSEGRPALESTLIHHLCILVHTSCGSMHRVYGGPGYYPTMQERFRYPHRKNRWKLHPQSPNYTQGDGWIGGSILAAPALNPAPQGHQAFKYLS